MCLPEHELSGETRKADGVAPNWGVATLLGNSSKQDLDGQQWMKACTLGTQNVVQTQLHQLLGQWILTLQYATRCREATAAAVIEDSSCLSQRQSRSERDF